MSSHDTGWGDASLVKARAEKTTIYVILTLGVIMTLGWITAMVWVIASSVSSLA